jgi:hypothetical protein
MFPLKTVNKFQIRGNVVWNAFNSTFQSVGLDMKINDWLI